MKTAELIQKDIPGYTGQASLYKVTPAMEARDWDGKVTATYDYVVVSATYVSDRPETYIFGGDADGHVVNWLELPGSFQGGLSEEQALRNAGYEVKT